MFTKVLAANRGEIAVRAFRAAYELGAQTGIEARDEAGFTAGLRVPFDRTHRR